MELCSMSCARLHRRAVWGRMDIGICMTESLRCSPETTTTLLYISVQNKKCLKFEKKITSYNLRNKTHKTWQKILTDILWKIYQWLRSTWREIPNIINHCCCFCLHQTINHRALLPSPWQHISFCFCQLTTLGAPSKWNHTASVRVLD